MKRLQLSSYFARCSKYSYLNGMKKPFRGSGLVQINSGGKNMSINRRSFIQTAAAVTASLSAPMVMANGENQVVVIGGGAGGATAASILLKTAKVQLT